MSDVLLVAGDVTLSCVSAFVARIRWTFGVDPLIGLVSFQYDDLRSVSYEAMDYTEANKAHYGEEFVRKTMREVAVKLLPRILPWGTTTDDIRFVIMGAEHQHRDAFDWVLPLLDDRIVYCYVRVGEDGQPWMECRETGNFDAVAPLGNLRGDTVFDVKSVAV